MKYSLLHTVYVQTAQPRSAKTVIPLTISLKNLHRFGREEKIFRAVRFHVTTSERKFMKYSTRHRFGNQPAVNSHVFCFKQRAIIVFLSTKSSSVTDRHKRLKASEDMTLRAET
jgi:hypothetical protein